MEECSNSEMFEKASGQGSGRSSQGGARSSQGGGRSSQGGARGLNSKQGVSEEEETARLNHTNGIDGCATLPFCWILDIVELRCWIEECWMLMTTRKTL